ncbi:MAG: glycosyltransferase, partial [Ignavibacteriales bacterium]
MIVKNEERYLQECLDSVKAIADEIIIVDTGSTDRTVQIAEQAGAKVYNFIWVNDFSAARNFALSKST